MSEAELTLISTNARLISLLLEARQTLRDECLRSDCGEELGDGCDLCERIGREAGR